MQLTFLEHKNRLTKIFHKDGITPYPNARKFTSHTEEVETIRDLYKHIENHASLGHCMIKGELNEPIINEPRAGKTKKHQKNQLFLLDIDGLELDNLQISTPITTTDLQHHAENIIGFMPTEFHDVSYVAQASASFGMKGNKLSMHIFFLLDSEIDPSVQKDVLTRLNFTVKEFEERLDLTATGKTLKYPLDICMAQNSRIIYIAPPIFRDERVDPIEQRLILVERADQEVNLLEQIMQANPEQNNNKTNSKIRALRRDKGLTKELAKTTEYIYEGETLQLCLNPDQCRIEFAYENGDFVYFNINGGDSNGYYAQISNPSLVFNFKGEPVFPMREADANFYEWFHTEYKERIHGTEAIVPYVFRGFTAGEHYNLLYDEKTLVINKISAANKGDLAEYMIQHNTVMPVPIPTMDYEFIPGTTQGINIEEGWVNKMEPTDFMLCKDTLDIDNLGYKTGDKLKDICPMIFNLIDHLMAGSEVERLHFINWICTIIKHRVKTQTAWILSGVQGTGKGVLYHKILHPILGAQAHYAIMKTMEDQFNDWLSRNVLFCLDEFKLDDSSNASKLNAFIKSLITEPYVTARKMRTDPVNVRSFSNCLMFSNQHGPQKIEPTDRRFNVAPRQETPINRAYPTFHEDVDDILPLELLPFMKFVNTYNCDLKMASLALNNNAKQRMYKVTENTSEAFALALRDGDLDYFIQNVLEYEPIDMMDDLVTKAAKQIIKAWLNQPEGFQGAHTSEVLTVYNAITGNKSRLDKMKKNLGYYGIKSPAHNVRLYKNINKTGWKIKWKLTAFNKEDVTKQYFTATDMKYLNDKVVPIK